MSKKQNSRLRVFFAEFEGDNETIQQGLETIGLAVAKTFESQSKTVKVIASSEIPEEQIKSIEAAEAIEEDEEVIEAKSKSKRKTSSYKPPNMTIVNDLNLHPENKTPFRSFYEDKSPQTQEQALVVAVYYLCNLLGLNGITPHHVFTCFKNVGRKTPNNLPQAIRDLAKRKAWVDTSEKGNIKITNAGENAVEHDLPPKK